MSIIPLHKMYPPTDKKLMFIYGQTGVGKTTSLAGFPFDKTLIISSEVGTKTLTHIAPEPPLYSYSTIEKINQEDFKAFQAGDYERPLRKTPFVPRRGMFFRSEVLQDVFYFLKDNPQIKYVVWDGFKYFIEKVRDEFRKVQEKNKFIERNTTLALNEWIETKFYPNLINKLPQSFIMVTQTKKSMDLNKYTPDLKDRTIDVLIEQADIVTYMEMKDSSLNLPPKNGFNGDNTRFSFMDTRIMHLKNNNKFLVKVRNMGLTTQGVDYLSGHDVLTPIKTSSNDSRFSDNTDVDIGKFIVRADAYQFLQLVIEADKKTFAEANKRFAELNKKNEKTAKPTK